MNEKRDFLIVGQGIAGSVCALKLIERGYSPVVIDAPAENRSSRVAAGLFNPVTGKKMVRTWHADRLWPAMYTFYREAERRLGNSFFIEMPIYRPFRGRSEMLSFANGIATEGLEEYIDEVRTESLNDEVRDTHGGLLLRQCGYLDIPVFLDSVRDYLLSLGLFHSGRLEPLDLHVQDEFVEWKGMEFKKVIFCEGWWHDRLPFFEWLPFRPVKGELLLGTWNLTGDMIYNRGVFVLPHRDGRLRIGATYDRNLDVEKTKEARIQLEKNLNNLLHVQPEIIDQWAGVRPATSDRKPIVGIHPAFETIAILNGLGTKGVSLAPYFAGQLIQLIEKTGSVDTQANIQRFNSLYLGRQRGL